MVDYEFSLKQEVLWEKGADVLGDLFRYGLDHDIPVSDTMHPVSILYWIVWKAKQNIIRTETEDGLHRIEGQFDCAREFLAVMKEGANA